MEGLEALREAAFHLAGARARIELGSASPEALEAVFGRGAGAIEDVLLLAELDRRGLEITRIDPFGTVVLNAGPLIAFTYRDRACGVDAMEDGSWRAFVDARVDVTPEQFEFLSVSVDRVGKRFDDLLGEVFEALDLLLARVEQVEAGGAQAAGAA